MKIECENKFIKQNKEDQVTQSGSTNPYFNQSNNLSTFQLELRADGAHWPSTVKNMLVSPIFVNEPLVQMQYLQIQTGLLKWSY